MWIQRQEIKQKNTWIVMVSSRTSLLATNRLLKITKDRKQMMSRVTGLETLARPAIRHQHTVHRSNRHSIESCMPDDRRMLIRRLVCRRKLKNSLVKAAAASSSLKLDSVIVLRALFSNATCTNTTWKWSDAIVDPSLFERNSKLPARRLLANLIPFYLFIMPTT
ncbi:hypothetical protein L3Y34_005187 [Caenorhabditis briggsae]|uniref:Uncharacterized protein n=1 Tax=Caenorhabditis briggsae TaxID=6238 RepID=A0AAE9AE31_CAEBR|nr:hypothetical protein L3Y34_005187 [Caenorhabditis briggsae]